MITYFEYLIVDLHVFYILNTPLDFVLIKCYLLFDPRTFFFMHNFILQNLKFKQIFD